MWNQLRARADALYDFAVAKDSRPLRYVAGLSRLTLDIWRQLVVDRAHTTAQSLAFTTILSMVPALAVIFAVFKAFVPNQELAAKVSGWLLGTLFANSVGEIVDVLQGFLDGVDTKTVGAVGFIFLLWTAISTFTAAEEAFNRIWRVPFTRPLHVRLMAYYVVLTLAPALIAASFLATNRVQQGLAASFGLGVASVAVSWLLEALALCLMYKLLPHGRVHWRAAIIGGVGGAVGFELTKAGFNYYIDGIYSASTSSQIYGTMALVPVFFLWIWLVWLMVLFGVELAYVAQHHQQLSTAVLLRRGGESGAPSAPTGYLLSRVFGETAQRFLRHGGGITATRLAQGLQLEQDEIELALRLLTAEGWLVAVDAEAERQWMPGRPLDRVSLADLYALAERAGYRAGQLPQTPGTAALEAAVQAAGETRAAALQHTFAALLAPDLAGPASGDPADLPAQPVARASSARPEPEAPTPR